MTALTGARLANELDMLDDRWEMATQTVVKQDDGQMLVTANKRWFRLYDTLREFLTLMTRADLPETGEVVDWVADELIGHVRDRAIETAVALAGSTPQEVLAELHAKAKERAA
jgi:hypothetical protein